jgi:hypothetical protein
VAEVVCERTSPEDSLRAASEVREELGIRDVACGGGDSSARLRIPEHGVFDLAL